MIKQEQYSIKDQEILQQVTDLLQDPSHDENPLRSYILELLDLCKSQQDNLNRLITISDGYHELIRVANTDLNQENQRQAKRLAKLAKISDLYQSNLHEINIKMERDALIDVLTGLYNRRYLMLELDKCMKKSKREPIQFSLGMLDLDYFKLINDNYNHEIGDQALQAVAKTIKSSIREVDLCGRWGGEEFLIVFPNTDLEHASQIATRILKQITQIKIPIMTNLSQPHITASIGVTIYHTGESYRDTIERADTGLLKAKKDGKNTLIAMQ